MIEDEPYRKGIKSPNGTENPFTDDSVVIELRKIQNELDSLLEDIYSDLTNPINKRDLITY